MTHPARSSSSNQAHCAPLSVRLSDLDAGSAVFLWAFRSCALGRARCGCLTAAFDFHFGSAGPDVLRHILIIAQALGQTGRRKIALNVPRSDRLSSDEAALLRALSAAQTRREAGLRAQLHWLAAGGPTAAMAKAACIVAGAFASSGLNIEDPNAQRT